MSHIIPKWAYKRARLPGAKVPDPISVGDGSIVLTSEQLSEELLCQDCEQEFGVYDNYIATIAYKDSAPPKILSLIHFDPSLDQHFAAANGLDLDKVKRFALSVGWRAHICESLPNVNFGKYGDQIEAFLKRKDPFPANVRLRVTLFVDSLRSTKQKHTLERLIVLPQSNRGGPARIHWFMLGGLRFELAVGSRHPALYGDLCIHHGRFPGILVQDPYGSGMVKEVASVFAKSKPRGKWAKITAR